MLLVLLIASIYTRIYKMLLISKLTEYKSNIHMKQFVYISNYLEISSNIYRCEVIDDGVNINLIQQSLLNA